MAKSEKKQTTPSSFEVTAPKAITPLMQAFHVNSEEIIISLILETARAISGLDGLKEISKEELNGVVSLMKGIKPQDTLETFYAAQIVSCHMLGVRKLSANYLDDRRLGLKLLRFSNEVLQQLEKKRKSGIQNITVKCSDLVQPIVIPNQETNPIRLCGAKCRTKGGKSCSQRGMKNGRCRMHGGIFFKRETHGGATLRAKAQRKNERTFLKEMKAINQDIENNIG